MESTASILQWLEGHPIPLGNRDANVMLAARANAVGAGKSGAAFGLASIGGPDVESALTADREVARLYKQPGATTPGTPAFKNMVTAFKDSPLTGLTTITMMALSQSGWDPARPNAPDSQTKALEYGKRITAAPFFTFVSSSSLTVNSSNSNWPIVSLLNRALSLFVGEGPQFVENIVTVIGDKYQLSILAYTLQTNIDNSLVMQEAIFNFNTATWPDFAERVASKQVTCTDEWSAKMTSPRQV
jgi:hypothetical protein